MKIKLSLNEVFISEVTGRLLSRIGYEDHGSDPFNWFDCSENQCLLRNSWVDGGDIMTDKCPESSNLFGHGKGTGV
ncbi:unnamed protein product [Pleuronectes platessa]|uniref:Uncharacterized protein n=1 Tax=Pleuronectes platessa TaxID=8262 RepID=A0A9N7VET4_PLEPL|nr:unnamed protein product [Pleuronectes platessa]